MRPLGLGLLTHDERSVQWRMGHCTGWPSGRSGAKPRQICLRIYVPTNAPIYG